MRTKIPVHPEETERVDRFSRHPIFSITVIVATAFIVAVVATEAILSQTAIRTSYEIGRTPPSPPRIIRLREWHPNTVFEGPPPEIRRLNPGSSVKGLYRLAIDENGFIAPSRIHQVPDAEIVFLGGSTTESMFVSEDKRFPYLAGRLLEARTGIRVNSFNGGKSGNNTMHSIFALTAKVLPMRPDIVVLMHNANDQGMLARFGRYWPKEVEAWDDFRLHLLQPKNDPEAALRSVRELTVPHTYRAFRRLLSNAAGLGMIGRAYAGTTGASPADKSPADLTGDTFRRALTQFVETAAIWDIRPVLMTQALETRDTRRPVRDDGGDYLAPERLARGGFTAASFKSSQEFFNAVIRRVAASTGSTLIDLAAAHPWSRNELYDGLHFNDDGSERVAEIVADALQPVLAKIRPAKMDDGRAR